MIIFYRICSHAYSFTAACCTVGMCLACFGPGPRASSSRPSCPPLKNFVNFLGSLSCCVPAQAQSFELIGSWDASRDMCTGSTLVVVRCRKKQQRLRQPLPCQSILLGMRADTHKAGTPKSEPCSRHIQHIRCAESRPHTKHQTNCHIGGPAGSLTILVLSSDGCVDLCLGSLLVAGCSWLLVHTTSASSHQGSYYQHSIVPLMSFLTRKCMHATTKAVTKVPESVLRRVC
jgi:hypothetical protein